MIVVLKPCDGERCAYHFGAYVGRHRVCPKGLKERLTNSAQDDIDDRSPPALDREEDEPTQDGDNRRIKANVALRGLISFR